MILLDARGLAASRPGRPLFEALDLTVRIGDRIGVVGLNGCGKSTLLSMLAGTVEPERGEVRRGREVRVAVLDQAASLQGRTLAEALRHDHLAQGWELDAVADRLGLGGMGERPLEELSGGQAKRVALTRALVAEAEVLVLDEPTNHLDIDAVDWLEERLAGFTGGLLVVSHDRHFLDRVTTSILELDRGRSYLHSGGYAGYLEARARRAEQAERAEAKRRNLARAELTWLRRGAPARTSKPKARIRSATEVLGGGPATEVRAGELPLASVIPRLGDRVVELHGVGFSVGDPGGSRSLFSDVELLLDPRERLGIVGPNGSGKSTLLGLMAERIEPTEGVVVHGSTARVAVYDQHGRDLDPTARVRDVVAGPDRVPDWADDALLEAFWFDGDAQWAPVGTLSGGERRRLQLLVTLASRPNVLLLDEPTNDLDLDTLRQLEDFLEQFPGAVVVVSHDRALLERVVTDVIVLGDGAAHRRPGGYAGYEAERRASRTAGRAGTAPSGSSASPAGPTASRQAEGTAGPAAPSPSTLRHRLRTAERDLDRRRHRAEELREQLAAAASDDSEGGHHRLAELGTELARAEGELADAEETWLAAAQAVEDRGLAT